MLLVEGGRAAVDHDDLTLDVIGIVRQEAVAVAVHASILKEDELILRAAAVLALVHRGDGSVGAAAGLREEDCLVAEGQVIAGLADVVHGGHGEGVGIAAGGADRIQVHAVTVEIAVERFVRPAAGVAGRDADHGVGILQLVQDLLVVLAEHHARSRGAQGQVDAVAAQDDGVLDGGHVIGVIRAAALAEDLHGEELGIRGNALGVRHFQRGAVGILARGNVAVGGGDAGHVGAVLALGVVIVGDIKIAVDIVIAEGQLGIAIESVCRERLVLLIGIQQGELIRDLSRSQEVIRRNFLPGVLRILRDGIFKRLRVKALVVGIRTGIDDGDAAAGAGVALGPRGTAADHAAGGRHVGIRGIGAHHGGLIAGLQDHVGHAGDGLDGLDVAVGHVGGDDVGRQGQVPDHIQLLAAQDLLGDPAGHRLLLRLQLVAVCHGLAVLRNVHGGEALFNGGLPGQDDGYTNHVRVLVERRFGLLPLDSVAAQRGGHHTVVDLLEPDVRAAAGPHRAHRHDEAQAQYERQHKRGQPLASMLPHMHPPFRCFAGVTRGKVGPAKGGSPLNARKIGGSLFSLLNRLLGKIIAFLLPFCQPFPFGKALPLCMIDIAPTYGSLLPRSTGCQAELLWKNTCNSPMKLIY